MTPAQRHMDIVARIGCVICREFHGLHTPAQVHHIAEGSGVRSDFLSAGLCPGHHVGKEGFHFAPKTFLRIHKLPTEYHLLLLVNKFRAEDRI